MTDLSLTLSLFPAEGLLLMCGLTLHYPNPRQLVLLCNFPSEASHGPEDERSAVRSCL